MNEKEAENRVQWSFRLDCRMYWRTDKPTVIDAALELSQIVIQVPLNEDE